MSGERVPVRDDLASHDPYGAPQFDVAVRLNTNETAEPPPASYLAEVARRLDALELNRYPDRRHLALRAALGARAGLDPDRAWAANGSNEILLQLFQAYGGPDRRAVTVRPGYSMYPVIARVTMTPLAHVDLDPAFAWDATVLGELADADADVVVIANPNNPTGVAVPLDVVAQLHDRCRGLLVVDEAYVEFGGESAITLHHDLPRLVVVRTFSKAFRLAGLRLGYLYAQPWVIDDLRRVRLPYHVDAIKQTAALVALEQEGEFLGHRQRVADERDRVAAAMGRMAGVTVWPSATNFLLFRVHDASAVFQDLLERGVLVRDFSSTSRLEGCLRVTIGTAQENDAFLDALAGALRLRR